MPSGNRALISPADNESAASRKAATTEANAFNKTLRRFGSRASTSGCGDQDTFSGA